MFYDFQNLGVLYNATRGCIFFWAILIIISLVWMVFMFIKKKIVVDSTNEDVYRVNKKEQPTNYQINNPPKDQSDQNQYQKSQNMGEMQKNSQVKQSQEIQNSATKPVSAAASDAEPTSGLQKALRGFQQYFFLYIPFFAINVLNLVCLRSWAFCLVVWFLIMIPIVIINLLGLYLKCENKIIQFLLRYIWVFVGVSWYINFYTILAPYTPKP